MRSFGDFFTPNWSKSRSGSTEHFSIKTFVSTSARFPTEILLNKTASGGSQFFSAEPVIQQLNGVAREFLWAACLHNLLCVCAVQADNCRGIGNNRYIQRHRLQHLVLNAASVPNRTDVNLSRADLGTHVRNVGRNSYSGPR